MTYYFCTSLYTPRRSLTARPLRKWMGLEDDPAFPFWGVNKRPIFFGENLTNVFHFQGGDLTINPYDGIPGTVGNWGTRLGEGEWQVYSSGLVVLWIFFGGCFVNRFFFFFFRFFCWGKKLRWFDDHILERCDELLCQRCLMTWGWLLAACITQMRCAECMDYYLHERWKMVTWTRGNGWVNIPITWSTWVITSHAGAACTSVAFPGCTIRQVLTMTSAKVTPQKGGKSLCVKKELLPQMAQQIWFCIHIYIKQHFPKL